MTLPTVPTDPAVVRRRSGRVLLVDSQDRILLFCGVDPAAPGAGSWWITPGGGLDPGESEREGAARELFEETGLRLDPAELRGPVHEREATFSFGGRTVRQHSTFFLARVDSHEVDVSGFEEVEATSIFEHRWWRVEELRATSEVVYPECLAELLAGLL